jgi:hypothetical protein
VTAASLKTEEEVQTLSKACTRNSQLFRDTKALQSNLKLICRIVQTKSHKLGLETQAHNPNTWEAEAGGWRVQG